MMKKQKSIPTRLSYVMSTEHVKARSEEKQLPMKRNNNASTMC